MPQQIIQGYKIELPKPPPLSEIDGSKFPLMEQYWRNPYTYTDEEFAALQFEVRNQIIEEEYHRRVFGYWFMNKGRPFYLTGDNYFFLTYWKINGAPAQFIINQSHEFYFDDMVDHDDSCFGSIKLKPRREGATERTLSRIANKSTMVRGKHLGIQSKTYDDAKNQNFRRFIEGFDCLPYWMKPKIAGSYPPADVLRFGKPTERMTKGNQDEVIRNAGHYLNTRIDCAATVENAYDGKKLFRWMGDEVAKMEEADVYDMWGIVRKCLVDGFDIIGKAYMLSTIGEVSEKAAAQFIKIWGESDHTKRNKLNNTGSGLYRWFIPAWATKRGKDPISGELIINEFGETNVALAKRALLAELEEIKDKRKRFMWMKQNPFTVEDAIQYGMTMSTFDNERLGDRRKEMDGFVPTPERQELYSIGNLQWVNGERFGDVQFVPHKEGRWNISYFPFVAGYEMMNRVKRLPNGNMMPFSDSQFIMGVDPYDYDETVEEGSKGAFLVKLKNNILNPQDSHIYCAEYIYRHDDANMFYEDVIKTAIFYGAKINPERKNYGIFRYLKDNRLKGFSINRPDITKNTNATNKDNFLGTPTTVDVVRLGCELIEGYIAAPNLEQNENIKDNLKSFNFDRTIDQLTQFTVDKKTKFDLVMAMIHTEIGAQSLKKYTSKQESSNFDADKVIDILFNRTRKSVYTPYIKIA